MPVDSEARPRSITEPHIRRLIERQPCVAANGIRVDEGQTMPDRRGELLAAIPPRRSHGPI